MNKNAVYAIGLFYAVAMAVLTAPAHAQPVNATAKCTCVCQSKGNPSIFDTLVFTAPGGDPSTCGNMNGIACDTRRVQKDMTLNSCGGRVDNSGRPVPTPPGPRFTPPPGGWQVQ